MSILAIRNMSASRWPVVPAPPILPPATNQDVYCSDDGGERWEQRISPAMNTAVFAFATDPSDSQIMYAGSNANSASYAGADPSRLYNTVGVVYKSVDGGRRWTELPTGLVRGTRVTDIRIDPQQPATVYASTSGQLAGGGNVYVDAQFGVLKSVDGGVTWKPMKIGLGSEPFEQAIRFMDLSPRDPSRLVVEVADTSSFLFEDGAGHFPRPATTPAGIMRFDPTDSTGTRVVGLSRDGTHVVESRDGGNSWREIGLLPAEIPNAGDPSKPASLRPSDIEISHRDRRILYLSGSGGSV